MQSRITKTFLSIIVILLPVVSNAQKVSAWLTNPEGTSLLAKQKGKLRFGSNAPAATIIDIDDKQSFQSIDGFGYALTGGSAQLLQRMTPGKRSALLHELFTTKRSGIGVSYLRLTIGSSDMNDHVFTYDDMPPGETDPNTFNME